MGNKKYFRIERIKNPLTLSNYKFSWTKANSAYPVVSSSGINNGTVNFVIEDKGWLNQGKSITIAKDGSIGSCFFQPFDFYANSHIFTLRLIGKEMNKFLAFFLCSVISLEKFRYSFGRAWILEDVLKTKILLPKSERNEPNWEYMEYVAKELWNNIAIDFKKELERL